MDNKTCDKLAKVLVFVWIAAPIIYTIFFMEV